MSFAFAALLATFGLVASDFDLRCDKGYELHNDLCYGLSDDVENYVNALKLCKNDNADLVSIHNAFDNKYVQNFNNEVLIGLRFNADSQQYEWSDGSILDYKNYANGFEEMHDILGNCAKLVNSKWSNIECEVDELRFVCVKQPSNYTHTPNNECPDPNQMYLHNGEILSPGYPDNYAGSSKLQCQYKLGALVNDFILVRFEEASIGADKIEVYKTFEIDEKNLVATIDSRFAGVEVIVRANLAALIFYGNGQGKWRITWKEVPSVLSCETYSPDITLFNQYCYDEVASPNSLDDAMDDCLEDESSEVISVHSEEENTLITKFYHRILIGLRNLGNGTYAWIDGTVLDYKNFDDDFTPQTDSYGCIQIETTKKNKWVSAYCGGGDNRAVCKRAAARIPDKDNGCPDEDAVFLNAGEVYNPGYPNEHNGSYLPRCSYHLAAPEGHIINIFFNWADCLVTRNTRIKVYEGWTADKLHLIGVVNDPGWQDLFISNNSNKMLIEFDATSGDFWRGTWFSTKDPRKSGLVAKQNGMENAKTKKGFSNRLLNIGSCPSLVVHNVGYNQVALTSPGYPTAYERNITCDFKSTDAFELSKGEFYQIFIVRYDIGHDDWISLTDLRTNTVFATSNSIIREGANFAIPFEFSLRFESGNAHGHYNQWRILFYKDK